MENNFILYVYIQICVNIQIPFCPLQPWFIIVALVHFWIVLLFTPKGHLTEVIDKAEF